MSELAALARMFVCATDVTRVLEIGSGTGDVTLAIAGALAADGLLITLERDATAAATARQRVLAAGHSPRVTVMIGDAGRYLHKIAGPFGLVVQNGDVSQYGVLHERVLRLIHPGGTLITNNVREAASYNELLDADARLSTARLTIGNGVAVSVLRKSP